MIGLLYGEKLCQYVEPFSSDNGTLRTDRQTDKRTELLYQYRASKYVLILNTGAPICVISFK